MADDPSDDIQIAFRDFQRVLGGHLRPRSDLTSSDNIRAARGDIHDGLAHLEVLATRTLLGLGHITCRSPRIVISHLMSRSRVSSHVQCNLDGLSMPSLYEWPGPGSHCVLIFNFTSCFL